MRNRYGNKLTRKLISKIFVSTTIYTIVVALIWLIGRYFCSLITWQPLDPLYQLLSGIGYNLVGMIIIWLLGFIIIFIYHLRKTLSYIDAIVDASEILVNNDENWIKLPTDLMEIEEKMNYIKYQSLHNLKLAREQEQRKNDLIIYLAHDIKTPLTSMIGYLSLLDEIEDMPIKKRNKYIKTALDKSYCLEDLINELFEITKFNSHNIVIEKDRINLTMMLEQIIDDFYPTLKELNKEIKLTNKKKIILEGDSDKLARVFNNVIKNAINYSRENTTITIDLVKEEEYVTIVISNKGKKISPDKLNKIFDKFYRLDSARTSKTGGSGLGLAIAKEIVLLHKGTISATSDEDETKFYIKLPI